MNPVDRRTFLALAGQAGSRKSISESVELDLAPVAVAAHSTKVRKL